MGSVYHVDFNKNQIILLLNKYYSSITDLEIVDLSYYDGSYKIFYRTYYKGSPILTYSAMSDCRFLNLLKDLLLITKGMNCCYVSANEKSPFNFIANYSLTDSLYCRSSRNRRRKR